MRQRLDVLGALAQRRDPDLEHLEPEEEVLAKLPALDQLFQRLVRRRDEPGRRFQRLAASQALKLALLQEAQELDLDRQRHVADLVQEQGPASGDLHPPEPARGGAVEGAALVTEELALDQRLREGGAVDADERLRLSRPFSVDGLGRHVLPCPVLAAQNDGEVAGRRPTNQILDLAHLGRRALGRVVLDVVGRVVTSRTAKRRVACEP